MSIGKYTRTIEGIEYVTWDYHKNVTGHINDALGKCIKERDELKAKLEEAEAGLKDVNDFALSCDSLMHTAHQAHCNSEQRLATIEAKLEKAEADFKNLEQTKNAWQDKAMRLEAERDELKAENKALMQQISMCRARMTDRDVESVLKQMEEWKAQQKGGGK